MIQDSHSKRTFLASLIVMSAYSAEASAVVRSCVPNAIVEVAPRSFQVFCSNGDDDGVGGVPQVLVYRAGTETSSENEAIASRFQAMVTAAILSGRFLRADMTGEATLCTGITDCLKANWWGLWPST